MSKLVGQIAGLSKDVINITISEREARLNAGGVGGEDVTYADRLNWLNGEMKRFGIEFDYAPGAGYYGTMKKPNKVPLHIPLDCFGDAVAWLIRLESKEAAKV